jgi:hypothetical protein
MKIEIEVSEKNEGTRAPWWAIIDPTQNMRCDIFEAARQITGPYFSREEAQGFLDATRYNFSARARVFCFSGCYSRQYDKAFKP